MSRGFTLLEVIIAIFILTIGVGGAFALITRTVGSSSAISNQLIASYLAQEGIEIVRNIRDSNFLEIHNGSAISWEDGLTAGCVAGCYASYDSQSLVAGVDQPLLLNAQNLYHHTGTTQTPFKRTITITPDGADKLKVDVDVSWEERNKPFRVKAATELYNWLNP